MIRTGFETIDSVLTGEIALSLLLLLIFGKILATTLTLGSGASGGVFAPALFVGAVLGGAYGQIILYIFPDLPISSGAYAMVGMAAVFAGAARAPITASIILFEMTQDYRIILPLMAATVISTIIAYRLEPESIYTLKLKMRGILTQQKKSEDPLQSILVEDAMTPVTELATLTLATSLRELTNLFQETSHHGFVVTDGGKLYGMVTLSDLEEAIKNDKTDATVGDICTKNVLTAYPDESLSDVLGHFGAMDLGRIPVVERKDPRHIVGILRRVNILHAVSSALSDKQHILHHMDRITMEDIVGAELTELFISKEYKTCGKRIKEIRLPENCVIVSIQRKKQVVVPRGFTQLLPGDRVIALVGAGSQDALREALLKGDDTNEENNQEAEENGEGCPE